VGTISTVYVIPKFRRKGIGTSLIRQLCEFFTSQNVEQVTLRYIIGNKQAEKFWKKLGFKPLIASAQTKLEDLKSKTLNT
jgi:predicted GNAT family acetyltransferase